MATTSPIQVLLRARWLLVRREGWVQGTIEAPRVLGGSAYCIHGAIDAASTDHQGSLDALRRMADALDAPVPEFNDAPETTQADVIAAIDRAIEAERNGDPIRTSGLAEALGITDAQVTAALNSEPVISGPDAQIIPFPDRRGVAAQSVN